MSLPRRRLRPDVDLLDRRCMLSSLTPALLTNAYGLNAIRFTTPSGSTVVGDGSGETIALIDADHDPTLASDLSTFDTAFGLPDPQLQVVNQAGAKTNSTWASEESLDVEWAHAIAPGANLLVVEARSQNLSDLLAAVNTARHTPGVVAISMSWGFTETHGETAYDSTFTTPAGHTGITFVAASGDSGPDSGAEYPAASPEVLAVGGTTLNLDDQGNYLSETPWSSGGGGYSQFEPEPTYQRSVQSSGRRSTPDVAFDGDPATGVQVYETPLSGGPGTWQTVGGTSLGAPAWAAIIAIADQGRALAGKPSLDGPTQTLPTLYSLANSTDFHTIDPPTPYSPWGGGINPIGGFLPFGGIVLARHQHQTSGGTTTGGSPAATLITGLGSPNAPPLIADLVASTTSAASPFPSAAPVAKPSRRLRHGPVKHRSTGDHAQAVRHVAPSPALRWAARRATRLLPPQGPDFQRRTASVSRA